MAATTLEIFQMCAIYQSLWVRKLIGKPAFLTIADCESDARRIHLPASIGYTQQSVPNPDGLVLVRYFYRILNLLKFNRVYASAKHDFARLSRRQLWSAHLFSFGHT